VIVVAVTPGALALLAAAVVGALPAAVPPVALVGLDAVVGLERFPDELEQAAASIDNADKHTVARTKALRETCMTTPPPAAFGPGSSH
jgi:hypothetical protein